MYLAEVGNRWFFLSPISDSPIDWGLNPISDSAIVSWIRQSDIWYSDSPIAAKITVYMLQVQNQRWDNITLTLHNNLGNLLPSTVSSTEILEARLSSKPNSGWHTHPVPHSSTSLHQHLSTCLSTTSASPHNFGHEGIRGSLLLGTGSKFSFSTVEKSCETNPLFQRTVIQIFRHSTFNQISTKRIFWTFIYVTSERTPKSTETLQNSFAKTTYSGLSFSSFSLSLYDIWVNIITRDIFVSLQKFFLYFYYTNSNILNMRCFTCNAILLYSQMSNFSLCLKFNPHASQYSKYVLCPMQFISQIIFNLALHCLYLCHCADRAIYIIMLSPAMPY